MSSEERLWLYEKRLEEIPLRVVKTIAKRMVAINLELDLIAKLTGLTLAEIENLDEEEDD